LSASLLQARSQRRKLKTLYIEVLEEYFSVTVMYDMYAMGLFRKGMYRNFD
jgi:hypothetical protein